MEGTPNRISKAAFFIFLRRSVAVPATHVTECFHISDVTAALLVSQINETASMSVSRLLL